MNYQSGYRKQVKRYQMDPNRQPKDAQDRLLGSFRIAFDTGNFSEIRAQLKVKDYSVRRTLERLYNEVRYAARFSEKEEGFGKWSVRELIKNAAIVAAYAVVSDMRTTQIRKIIEMAKNLHTKVKTVGDNSNITEEITKEALRMNMLMAYYSGKNRSVLPIQEVLEPILSWLSKEGNATPENFEKVYTFFEAIVAYHKYFGGKE